MADCGNIFTTSTSCASLLAALFLVRQLQHITRLTTERPADLLQGREIDAHRPARLQPPQRRVADARFLRQPVESPPALFQQLIDPNFDHNALLSRYSISIISEIYRL